MNPVLPANASAAEAATISAADVRSISSLLHKCDAAAGSRKKYSYSY